MRKGSPVLAVDVWCMQSLWEPSVLWAGRSNSVLRIWARGGLLGGAHNPACPWISLLWDFSVVQREGKHWATPLLGLLWNHSGSFKRFPYWEGCPVIKWLLPKKQSAELLASHAKIFWQCPLSTVSFSCFIEGGFKFCKSHEGAVPMDFYFSLHSSPHCSQNCIFTVQHFKFLVPELWAPEKVDVYLLKKNLGNSGSLLV